jgi:hypothetical protein
MVCEGYDAITSKPTPILYILVYRCSLSYFLMDKPTCGEHSQNVVLDSVDVLS